jgi:putative glutamine amidotransferase
MNKRPLIGCSTYFKTLQDPPIHVYGLMTSYIEAVIAAGGIPIMIPLGLGEEALQAIFEKVDGVLIPGGGDIDPARYRGDTTHPTLRDINPARDDLELFLAREAVQREKPLLAICRGHQVFNVALGGTLFEDVLSQKEAAQKHDYFGGWPRTHLPHEVHVEPDSRLAQLLGDTTARVNSLHHQGIKELATDLRPVATAPDGLIEAIEVPGHRFALGVQWHPENLIHEDRAMLRLFQGLVEAANGTGS